MSIEDEEDLDMLGVKAGAVITSSKTKYVIIKLLGEGGFGAVSYLLLRNLGNYYSILFYRYSSFKIWLVDNVIDLHLH